MEKRPLARSSFIVALLFALFSFTSLGGANKKVPPAHPININTATSQELQQVPGIGPVTADKILKLRKIHGPFKSVNELRAIKGIGPKRLAKMKPFLTVGPPTEASKPPESKKPAPPN